HVDHHRHTTRTRPRTTRSPRRYLGHHEIARASPLRIHKARERVKTKSALAAPNRAALETAHKTPTTTYFKTSYLVPSTPNPNRNEHPRTARTQAFGLIRLCTRPFASVRIYRGDWWWLAL